MIIAIDGTASSGKSSIARALGKKLEISVLGTGSIYRAIAYKVLNFDIPEDDDIRIKSMLDNTIINLAFSKDKTIILLDGIIQSKEQLNSPLVSAFTPKIACKSYVRDFVRKIQKQEAKNHPDIIVEGRDIGSVVFPNADLKIFIDADQTTRAQRRLDDYIKQGKDKTLNEVIQELETRDLEDRTREISPLIMAQDSIIIDTTSLPIEKCVEKIEKIIKEKL